MNVFRGFSWGAGHSLLAVVGLAVLGAGVWVVGRQPVLSWFHRTRATSYEARAREAVEAKRWEDARIYAQEAVRHEATGPRLQLMGEVERQLNRPAYLGYFDRALALDSNNVELARLFVGGAADLGARDFAGNRVPELARRFSNDVDVLYGAGRFYLGSREAGPALILLRRAEKLQPEHPGVGFAVATACLLSAEGPVRQEGLQRLERLRQVPGLAEPAVYALARWRSRNEPNTARLLWAELVAARPDSWTFRLGQADNWHDLKDDAWREALVRLRKDAANRDQRLDVARRIGMWEGPAALDRWALELSPDEARSEAFVLVRLETLSTAGRHTEVVALAAAETRRAGLTPAHEVRCWLASARAQRALGDSDLARMNARNAASVAAKHPHLAYGVGLSLEELDLPDEALRLYEVGTLSTGQGRSRSLDLLNRRALERGETDRLIDALEQVTQDDAADVLALNNLACLLVQDPKTAARGLALATRARKARPDDPLVADTYAWALAQNDRLAEALDLYESLPAMAFRNPEVTLHFAEVLNRSGQRDRAREMVRTLSGDGLLPRDREILKALQAP